MTAPPDTANATTNANICIFMPPVYRRAPHGASTLWAWTDDYPHAAGALWKCRPRRERARRGLERCEIDLDCRGAHSEIVGVERDHEEAIEPFVECDPPASVTRAPQSDR